MDILSDCWFQIVRFYSINNRMQGTCLVWSGLACIRWLGSVRKLSLNSAEAGSRKTEKHPSMTTRTSVVASPGVQHLRPHLQHLSLPLLYLAQLLLEEAHASHLVWIWVPGSPDPLSSTYHDGGLPLPGYHANKPRMCLSKLHRLWGTKSHVREMARVDWSAGPAAS